MDSGCAALLTPDPPVRLGAALLSHRVVQQQRALVVLLVDLLDASGSILGKVRELIGKRWMSLARGGSCL